MSPKIQQKLDQLRRKLAGWILVHGLGRWLMVVLVVLACDVLLDRVFKMDFAQRFIMLLVIASTALVYLGWRVVRPLLKRANDDSLIYEIELKNPELQENLISSWQLSRETQLESFGISSELAAATIHSGIARAEQIDFAKSLDRPQNRQNWMLLLAGVVLSVALGFGIAKTDLLRTWFNRNLLLLDDQWPQGTYLEIVGVKNGKLVIPRGTDYRQLVFITDNSTVQEVGVSLEIDTLGGRTVHSMKPTGKMNGREKSHLFHNVSSSFRFRASGGDDVTEWIDVALVEPPAVIELELNALLPAYTGVPSLALTGNGPHAVLTGSSLQIQIKSNKPLQQANLKIGGEPIPLLSIGDDRYSLTLAPDQLRGGEYEITLLDETGLANSRPSKFSLTIKEDQPPKARASLLGISGLVVPQASLPVSYQATDEFGLQRMYFDCQWTAITETEQQPTQRDLPFADFANQQSALREIKDYAVLDLRPLRLTPGISFRFSVAVVDSCPSPPGIGKSQEFLLRIVTNEELRADLLRREIEQRKAFEQAYEVQMELASEIQAIPVKRAAAGVSPEQFLTQRESELIALVRNQKSIGTSIARVADRFEEFLVEVKNNRLDEAENEVAPSQKIETRFDTGIIQPIRKLDQELISLATRNLDNCRRSSISDAELTLAVDQTSLVHQQILVEMKKILDAMNDSENFQEVINDLLRIKDDANLLKTDIEKKLKPKDIFDQPDSDIFDK